MSSTIVGIQKPTSPSYLRLDSRNLDSFLYEYANSHLLSNEPIDTSWISSDTLIINSGDASLHINVTHDAIMYPAPLFIVIPGTSDGTSQHLLDPICLKRVRVGLELAQRLGAQALLLSGYKGSGLVSEARQMYRMLPGTTRIPVILDHVARSTAGNAVCSHRILTAIHPESRVVTLAAWSNGPRQHLIFRKVYGAQRVQRTVMITGKGNGGYWKPGLLGVPLINKHIYDATEILGGQNV